MKLRFLLVALVTFVGLGCRLQAAAATRPNIIIIMADDVGYSDIGCYGGEVATPNLDRLAGNGVRFTQFYNMGRCCPTRASLLTGLYPTRRALATWSKMPGPRVIAVI
jgi:arylsulfatase